MYLFPIRDTHKPTSLIWEPNAGEAMVKCLEIYVSSSISSTAHPNTTLRDVKRLQQRTLNNWALKQLAWQLDSDSALED